MSDTTSSITVTYIIPPDAVVTSGVHQTGQPPGVVGGGDPPGELSPNVLKEFSDKDPIVLDTSAANLTTQFQCYRKKLAVISIYKGIFEAALASKNDILDMTAPATVPAKGTNYNITVTYVMKLNSALQANKRKTALPPAYTSNGPGNPDGSPGNPYIFDATDPNLDINDEDLRQCAAVASIFKLVFEAELAFQNKDLDMYPKDNS